MKDERRRNAPRASTRLPIRRRRRQTHEERERYAQALREAMLRVLARYRERQGR